MILIGSKYRLLSFVRFNDGSKLVYSMPRVETRQFIIGVSIDTFGVGDETWSVTIAEDGHSLIFDCASGNTSSYDSYDTGSFLVSLLTTDNAAYFNATYPDFPGYYNPAGYVWDGKPLKMDYTNELEIGTAKLPGLMSYNTGWTVLKTGDYYDQVIDVSAPYNIYVKNHKSHLATGWNIAPPGETPSYYPGVVEVNRTQQGLTSPADPHSIYGTPNYEFVGWVAVWNEDRGNIPNIKGVGFWIKWSVIPVISHHMPIQANDFIQIQQGRDLSDSGALAAEVYGLESVAVTPTCKRLILNRNPETGNWMGSASITSGNASYSATWTFARDPDNRKWVLTEQWSSQSGMTSASGTETTDILFSHELELWPSSFNGGPALEWYLADFVFIGESYYYPWLSEQGDVPPEGEPDMRYITYATRDTQSTVVKRMSDGKFYATESFGSPLETVPCTASGVTMATPGVCGVDVFNGNLCALGYPAAGSLVNPNSVPPLHSCESYLYDSPIVDFKEMYNYTAVDYTYASSANDLMGLGHHKGSSTVKGYVAGRQYKYEGGITGYPDGNGVIRGFKKTGMLGAGPNIFTQRIEHSRETYYDLIHEPDGTADREMRNVFIDRQIKSVSFPKPIKDIMYMEVFAATGGHKHKDYHQDANAIFNVGISSSSEPVTINYDHINMSAHYDGTSWSYGYNPADFDNTSTENYFESYQYISDPKVNPDGLSKPASMGGSAEMTVVYSSGQTTTNQNGNTSGWVNKTVQYQWIGGSTLQRKINGGSWETLAANCPESTAAATALADVRLQKPKISDWGFGAEGSHDPNPFTPVMLENWDKLGGTVDSDWESPIPSLPSGFKEVSTAIRFTSSFPSHADRVKLTFSKHYSKPN